MFGGIFGGMGGGVYNQNYRAYPVAFIEKEAAEKGDKLILPPSALQTLASMHVQYPMLFRVTNKRESRHTHCGVLEFVAQEGMCYMPQWVMDNLLLGVGDIVNLQNVSLPKGTFIKIQPHTSDFLEISNPKAVLETSLRSFTCLTEGDTFVIEYNDKKFYIDVLEVRPDSAISVVETDVNVDFAPPKDYKEPDYKAEAAARAEAEAKAKAAAAESSGEKAAGDAASPAPEEPKFMVFGGAANRLDGKVASPGEAIAVPVSQVGREPSKHIPISAAEPAKPSADDKAGPSKPGVKSGKVVFGGGDAGGVASNRLAARRAAKASGQGQPAPKPAPPKEEKPVDKWAAFEGKGRSLRD